MDDLNRLELAALEADDFQDYDIDGSQVGGGSTVGYRHSIFNSRKQLYQQEDSPLMMETSLEGTTAPGAENPPSSSSCLPQDRKTTVTTSSEIMMTTTEKLKNSPSRRSVGSWDSHTHYQHFRDRVLQGVVVSGGGGDEVDTTYHQHPSRSSSNHRQSSTSLLCYCDMSTFKTSKTILRVLLVVRYYVLLFVLKFHT